MSISRCRDLVFTPYGVTTDQYALISIVRSRGEIKQSELGAAMFADPNTISSMLSLMEKRGVVTRKPAPSDSRARLVRLTKAGEQLFQYLSRDWEPMRLRLAECFSGADGSRALAILDRVTADMTNTRSELLRSIQHSHSPANTTRT
jgi:DNA-binding MarR family transcriptional regulator